MIAEQIKCVIFDLGKVLFDFDWQIALGRLENRTRMQTSEIYALIANSRMHLEFETGVIGEPIFFNQLKDKLGFDGSAGELKKIWNEIFTPITSNLELPGMLGDKVCLVLLSNTNPAHFEHLSSGYDFVRHFDHLVLSHEVGLVKPDLRIFQHVCQLTGFEPKQCLFIDDLAENSKAASSLGIRVVQYTGQSLRTELGGLL